MFPRGAPRHSASSTIDSLRAHAVQSSPVSEGQDRHIPVSGSLEDPLNFTTRVTCKLYPQVNASTFSSDCGRDAELHAQEHKIGNVFCFETLLSNCISHSPETDLRLREIDSFPQLLPVRHASLSLRRPHNQPAAQSRASHPTRFHRQGVLPHRHHLLFPVKSDDRTKRNQKTCILSKDEQTMVTVKPARTQGGYGSVRA